MDKLDYYTPKLITLMKAKGGVVGHKLRPFVDSGLLCLCSFCGETCRLVLCVNLILLLPPLLLALDGFNTPCAHVTIRFQYFSSC